MSEVVLIVGYPASGKSSVAAEQFPTHRCLNRDKAGGKVIDLLPKMTSALRAGESVVLDNTFATAASRKPFIDAAKERGVDVHCFWLKTSIEDAQYNACWRMMDRYGEILSPDRIKKLKDPNIFPPAVLFRYRKDFEEPRTGEGFDRITTQKFVRRPFGDGKGLFLDLDGTVRTSSGEREWPEHPDDVVLMDRRREIIQRYFDEGWGIFAVTNQSAVSKGSITESDVVDCLNRTLVLLSEGYDYKGHNSFSMRFGFCPHNPAPI